MFDIGFPELVLVSIVALLVIGPERLPETVRTISLWVGRFRRSVTSLKEELEREIGADEIRQQLHNESIMQELEQARNQVNAGIRDAEQGLRDMTNLDPHPIITGSADTTDQPATPLEDAVKENPPAPDSTTVPRPGNQQPHD